jgi:hypothetical protein
MNKADIKVYPNALILISHAYIQDGREMVPIVVDKPRRKRGGQRRPEIYNAVYKPMLVEAWLAVKALTTLDVRGMHPDDPPAKGPDLRDDQQREIDARRLVELQLPGVSLDTVETRGRVLTAPRYGKANKEVYRDIREIRLLAQRHYSTLITDLPAGWTPDYFVADIYLRRVKGLGRAVKAVEDTLEVIRDTQKRMQISAETPRKIAISQGTFFPKFGVSDWEEMHYVSHASGINAADIWHGGHAQVHRDAFTLSILRGKEERGEPFTAADHAFMACRVEPLVCGETPAITPSDRALREMALDIIEVMKLSDFLNRKAHPGS